ncbi:MAG: toxin-antitoxin system HicB family antitoxin [Coxiellaceae bacterium]|nr:toxin-antitoxin system HicB family antitoxin [Coxiellaceae bacterium]
MWRQFSTIVDQLKSCYRCNPLAPSKKQYSGQFNVRIDKRVHRLLALEAAQVGLSLNALVAQKLTLAVHKGKTSRA